MNPSLEYPGRAVAPSSGHGLWLALGVWFTGSVVAAALGLLQAFEKTTPIQLRVGRQDQERRLDECGSAHLSFFVQHK